MHFNYACVVRWIIQFRWVFICLFCSKQCIFSLFCSLCFSSLCIFSLYLLFVFSSGCYFSCILLLLNWNQCLFVYFHWLFFLCNVYALFCHCIWNEDKFLFTRPLTFFLFFRISLFGISSVGWKSVVLFFFSSSFSLSFNVFIAKRRTQSIHSCHGDHSSILISGRSLLLLNAVKYLYAAIFVLCFQIYNTVFFPVFLFN